MCQVIPPPEIAPNPPCITLVVRPVRGFYSRRDMTEEEWDRRLKAAIKSLLRDFGLRCVVIHPPTCEELLFEAEWL